MPPSKDEEASRRKRGGGGRRRGEKKGGAPSEDALKADALEAAEAALGAIAYLEKKADGEAAARAAAAALRVLKKKKEAEDALKARVDEAKATISDWNKVLETKRENRFLNGPEEASTSRARFAANKKKYKSDLKRTTAFVKKVKTGMSEDQKASLMTDVENLNLTLYVSELVSAVAETKKTKDKDVALAALVCSTLHRRHADFSPALVKELESVLDRKKDLSLGEDVEKRRRAATRLLLELVVNGLVPQPGTFVTHLAKKVMKDPATFALFVRAAAPDLLGIAPDKVRKAKKILSDEEDEGDLLILDKANKEALQNVIDEGYDALLAQLLADNKSLKALEKKLSRDASNQGSLSDQKEKVLKEAKKAQEKLFGFCVTIAEALNREGPADLDSDEDSDLEVLEKGPGISVYLGDDLATKKGCGAFDDETERALYEDYPNVLDLLPAGVLGLAETDVDTRKAAKEEQKALWRGESLADIRKKRDKKQQQSDNDDPEDDNFTGEESLDDQEGSKEQESQLLDDDDDGTTDPKKDDDEKELLVLSEDDEDEEAEATTQTGGSKLTKLLTEDLAVCFSRERADEIALALCDGLLVKAKARKRLAKQLLSVPRTALELLPHYARVTAVVSVAYRDVADIVVQELSSEFRYWLRRKSQHTLESRIKNIRFLAELVKFRIAPPRVIFGCLHTCIDDFSNHNVDVACTLLEISGSFLLRSPPTKDRVAKIIEAMMRLKKARPLNAREAALVDSVYYRCFPVDAAKRAPKKRSQLYKYVQFLLVHSLCKRGQGPDAVDDVVKELRKLPWDDEPYDQDEDKKKAPDETIDDAEEPSSASEKKEEEEIVPAESTLPLVVKMFLKLARFKADSASLAADALSGLHKYRPRVSSRVVDAVLEELDLGLETPASQRPTGANQRLVAFARFFAELYNFSLVSTHQLLATLRRLLHKGHDITDDFRSLAASLAAYQEEIVVNSAAATDLGAVVEADEEEDEEDEEENKEEEKPEEEEESPYASPSRRARYSVLEQATHDPRVPCASDEANDFLRVSLCCTILRITAPCVVAVPAARGPLQYLVEELQRYFFCKPMAPLGPRYALLDCIEELERGAKALAIREAKKARRKKDTTKVNFKVRDCWYEAHDAVQAHETAVAAVAALRELQKNGGAREAPVEQEGEEERALDEDDDDDPDAADDDEDDDDDDDDEDDDDDDDDDDEDDDDLDDEGEEEEEEEDEDFASARRNHKSPEDLEFEAMLAATVETSMASSRMGMASDSAAKTADNMVMPTAIARRADPGTNPFGSGLKFQMLKRGAKGRLETRDLFVPTDSTLASQVQRNEAAQRREHDLLKQRTLMQARNQDD